MASKDMKITIGADQVMYSNISKSKDGYNSARVVAKVNDKEYMSVSYEWEGDGTPDFALNLMGFMQANFEGATSVETAEYAEMAAKKGKKGVNPFAKDKDKEDPEEDPKDKKKKKDDKKKKKEKSEEDKTPEEE
jgi:hypothetical protein